MYIKSSPNWIVAHSLRRVGARCAARVCGACLLLMSVSAFADLRIWHTKDGSRFEAEFVREKPGKVFLKGTDNQNFTVALTNLVANDVKYIRTMIVPDVGIDFYRKIEEKERSDYAWLTAHAMEVTGTVTVKRKSKAQYDGKLPAEVYLIAKEVATDDYRLFAKKGFTVEFPGGGETCDFIIEAVITNYEEYTAEMRGAFYEGHVVIVFDLQGNRLAFDTDLSWLDESRLEALRKLPVPGFFDQACKKRSVPRPSSEYEGTDFSY